jgi:hypothetical protein
LKPLLAARVRDIRRGVQSGGGGGTPGSSALRYNPGVRMALAPGFSTYNVPVGTGSSSQYLITLAAGEHAKVFLPTSQARMGPVRIEGSTNTNNRVWLIGGQVKDHLNLPRSNNDMVTFAGIDHVYVEGVWFDKRNTVGSAIGWAGRTANSPAGTAPKCTWIWLQNCLVTGVNYADTGDGDADTEHGDFLIQQHECNGGVRMHQCTAWFWNTGLITTNSPVTPGGYHFSKCNFILYDSRYNPKPNLYPSWGAWGNSTNHSVFLQGCTVNDFRAEDVYIHDDQPIGNFPITDSNGTTTHTRRGVAGLLGTWQSGGCLTITGDTYTGTATGSGFTGSIIGGIPPNGHFVNSGTVSYGSQTYPNATGPVHTGNFDGLNYPQPGTAGHPGYQE